MLNDREIELNEALRLTAESLDILPSKHKQAVERYGAVGEWLEAGQYNGCSGLPEIGPQGSFRLGTVVRPIRDGKEGDYDIDLVCRIPMEMSATTPAGIKGAVGDRLKEHADYRRMLDAEGRRCWTLEYAEQDGIGFHMDILPSIPDDPCSKAVLITGNIPWEYAQHALAITEKDKPSGLYSWKEGGTNPEGYAKWFDDINRPMFTRAASVQKQLLVAQNRAVYCSVDEVPDALVRTPLQRAIQLLKRHRDMRFLGHPWKKHKPISVVITTLAAQAYQGESDVYSSLRGITDRLGAFSGLLELGVTVPDRLVDGLIQKRDGRWYIPNPVNHDENFADRWNDARSRRAEAFFQWLSWVREDLQTALGLRNLRETKSFLEPTFGCRPAEADIPSKASPPARTRYPAVAIANPSKPWGTDVSP